MSLPKFSLQNVLDIRHDKVELLEIELGKLLATHQPFSFSGCILMILLVKD